MATEYQTKKVTELEAKTTAEDTDLLAVGGGGGAILKKMTLSTLANWIKTKVSGFTYAFNHGTMTIQSAINALTLKSGNSLNYSFNGGAYVTTGGTVVGFTVPLARNAYGVSNPQIEMTSLQMRQNGKYLYQKATGGDFSDLSVGCYKTECGLNVTVVYSPGGTNTAFPNVTNNDCVGVQANFKITWG